ncbi:MAG: PrsW family intramembrane metalloprotease [Kouleothrix sp.]|jgi:RsiW-degrading membrane proteinase PrsW (M82 family)|nr:PrsW family intramembrane metalloprotease [Kouleothrix sp.]
MNVLAAILAAAVPAAFYGLLIWWLDRYEKEPLWLIILAFVWGSLPAIGLSLLFEVVLRVPIAETTIGPNLGSWGLAALVEEPIKALALIGLFLFMRREFDGTLDGIVYGSLVGFGFSMTENLLYFLHYGANLEALFWLRSVFFGLNHAFFTSLIGLALGVVRYRRAPALRLAALGGGLTLAILFHALHNYAVRFRLPGLLLSWLLQSGGVLVILAIVMLSWRKERQWIEHELREEVRGGVLAPSDYLEISSPARRLRRQLRALFGGGWASFARVRRLHHLATKLAFCKTQLGLDDRHYTSDDRDRLRGQITELRATLERDEQAWAHP